MECEWDEKKNKLNQKKHGISFEEAQEIFQDPNAIEFFDKAHSSSDEYRFGCIGMCKKFLVVTVFFTDRSGKTRIFSARQANQKERSRYYEELRKNDC